MPPVKQKVKKKVGAKPNPFIEDMAAWRREKNRQAQQALRDRKAQETSRQQAEIAALQSRLSVMESDNAELRRRLQVMEQNDEQMRQLLALAFSAWFPEDAQMVGPDGTNEAVMLAARALSEMKSARSGAVSFLRCFEMIMAGAVD
ncbi:hypothetical protein HDV00_001902 [Rhizophlyctis rosea]|nr:hypothetical protein HDV00_001902 [Rhizophlyctis rosea]